MIFSPPWLLDVLCSSALPVYNRQFGCFSMLWTYVWLPGHSFCQAFSVRNVTCFTFVFMAHQWIHKCVTTCWIFSQSSCEISASRYPFPGLRMIALVFDASILTWRWKLYRVRIIYTLKFRGNDIVGSSTTPIAFGVSLQQWIHTFVHFFHASNFAWHLMHYEYIFI